MLNILDDVIIIMMFQKERNCTFGVIVGKYFPSPENLVKISQALNVSLSDLFSFSKEYSCEDYMREIRTNIEFLKNNKLKLSAISCFIKNILLD